MAKREAIQPTKLYTPVEAASALGVSKDFIYKEIRAEKISSTWLGKGHKILGEKLLSYVGSSVYTPNNPVNYSSAAPTFQK